MISSDGLRDFSGCLHAHISYLDDTSDVCLVLMTVNPEHFQILSDFRQRIADVRALTQHLLSLLSIEL